MSERVYSDKDVEGKETIKPSRLLVDISDISYSIGNKPLFNGLSFSVREGEAVALIGASGTGKSTLLKMIIGMEKPDQGEITIPGKVKIGYVAQDLESLDHAIGAANVKEMFLRAKGLDVLEKKIRGLEAKMADDYSEELMEVYSRTMDEYEKRGGYIAESKIMEVLVGMGLGNIELDNPVNEMSSGQKVRLMIAQALFVEPDLLILDDPVSHLDAQARGWLSAYIKKTSQGCLITTADVDFINGFANKVVEISPFGRAIAFKGNYRDFVPKRDQLLEAERVEYERVQTKLEQLRVTLKEQKIWGDINTAASVHVRRTARRIDRLEREGEEMPGSATTEGRRVKKFRFEEEYRSGEDVVKIRGVRKNYGDHTALDLPSLDLLIKRGEVFTVMGGNGSGKSTLLRVVARTNEGDFTPESGIVLLGSSIKIGYYAPEWNTQKEDRTVFEEAKSAMEQINEGRVRAILNYWGFDARIAERTKVGSLSKGEIVQLSLAKLMLNRGNLLILDEPSTNLTRNIKERLVESLRGYTGTIILATHDPELLDALEVSRSLILPQGKVILGREK